MKNTMKKTLCLVLALMMAVPLMVFPANAATAYANAADGDLLYAANFNGDETWQPSTEAAIENAGWEWTDSAKLQATVDAQDSSKATFKHTGTVNAAWGGNLEDYPLASGYNYTIKFTMTFTNTSRPVGLLIDGHYGAWFYTNKMRLRRNGSNLSGSSDKSFSVTSDNKEFAIVIEGNTKLSVYVKGDDGEWTHLTDGAPTSADGTYGETLGLYFYAYHSGAEATFSNVGVYKGLADKTLVNEPEVEEPPVEEPLDSTLYDAGSEGDVLWTANFNENADANWTPSYDDVYEKAGWQWTNSENMSATADENDPGKATVKLTKQGNAGWGDNVVGLPLGEGYNYTVKFTMGFTGSSKPLGLLIDGHNGAYLYSYRARLQYNGGKLKDYVNYTSNSGRQEYAFEINGDDTTFALYMKNSDNEWVYVDGGNTKNGEFESDYLGIYFYAYSVTEATVSGLKVYKGLSVIESENEAPRLKAGAAVRLDNPTGLRFTGFVGQTYLNNLKTKYGADNVAVGMLITPTDYLTDNGLAFTKDALDACDAITGYKYLEIDAETILTAGDYYQVNCAIVNILAENYDRAFSAIMYVKVTDGATTTYTYSAYDETDNTRTVKYVAEAAYEDLAEEESDDYANPVVVGDVTYYSPYTEAQRTKLEGFFR